MRLFKARVKAESQAGWVSGVLVLGIIGSGLGIGSLAQSADFTELKAIAERGLGENLNPLTSGTYLSAGSHQFKGLWTRDFVYGSRGLFATGRSQVVKDQVELILKNLRENDGLVPRYLDSLSTAMRYYYQLVFGTYPKLTDSLKPNYLGGGSGGEAADSNLLTILAALEVVRETGDEAWFASVEPELVRAFHYYDHSTADDGLVVQQGASDWQDSVTGRKGKTFYVNVLWAAVQSRLVAHPAFGVTADRAARTTATLLKTFYDSHSGLYFSIAGQPYISLDGILLALDLGVVAPNSPEGKALFKALKKSEFWMRNPGLPGFDTYPNYPSNWIDEGPRLSGLSHYHDSIYWSWLMGLSAKVAYLSGDRIRGDIILMQLQDMAIRDGNVQEIYRDEFPLQPYNNLVYKSERPFSWGIGMTLDAIRTRAQTFGN